MSNIEGISVGDIIHSISDSKSLDLFCSIAKGNMESEELKETKGLSRKQFYTRTSQLLKQGLIQRSKGRLFTHKFGNYCISRTARNRSWSQ